MPTTHRMSAKDALDKLREGNKRYAADVRSLEAMTSHSRRSQLAKAQDPCAIVMGCSDSRVPAEIVFDQGR
jgi:carbonic anhydrase